MSGPLDPEVDPKTGKLITEWFEHPEELTDEELRQVGVEKFGLSEYPEGPDLTPEQRQIQLQINAFVQSRKNRNWPSAYTKQEIQVRLNEAAKIATAQKFLPEEVTERTGLQLNPLWMMETLVRSGVLTPKEQVNALKELATYTHSKAPTINHSTTTHMKPEDWLLEIAQEEYQTIEVPPKKVRVAAGAGAKYLANQRIAKERMDNLQNFQSEEFSLLEAEVDDLDFEEVTFGGQRED